MLKTVLRISSITALSTVLLFAQYSIGMAQGGGGHGGGHVGGADHHHYDHHTDAARIAIGIVAGMAIGTALTSEPPSCAVEVVQGVQYCYDGYNWYQIEAGTYVVVERP
ncbi:hypothetical protein [Falsihalocynthiibacter arcticus]|uniref:hypothetical protein n=1 Tax=Falsihalocynthiibacter arcticus TaxID=1579316 RepID=UPI0012E9888C|nr:hypothetical protein [Falsihalocynthiibacter arcticus]